MKIGFLKLCCPGDLLFTTPAVRAVKKTFPNAELYYLTGKYSSFIAEHNPHIDKTILISPPYEAGGKLRALAEFHNGFFRIWKEDFDLLFCFHRAKLVALLGLLGRAKRTFGFDTTSPICDTTVRFDPQKHEVARYLDLVGAASCGEHGMELEYATSSDEDERGSELLRELGVSGEFAVIAPGGGENPGTIMHTKRLPIAKFKEVSNYLREKYRLPVVAVGSESERSLAEELNPDFNLAGKTTFPMLAAILKQGSILIANDSGPLYLGSAVGTKTVGIYGPSSDKLVAPLAGNHRSVRKEVWCGPCYEPETVKRGIIRCPSGTWACMLALETEQIKSAVDELLD